MISLAARGQTVDIEKTYDVSKEAMKGFIHLIDQNDDRQQIDVVYRIRAKKNQAKFITYTFDYNFNFVNTQEEIVDMEKEIPVKYKQKKYKGENYQIEGLFVEPNMMGTVVVKRKVTSFSWP